MAIAIFGDIASCIIIATYIGSSVFGNLVSVAALQPKANWRLMAKRTLISPPVLAVITGLSLRGLPFDLASMDELGVAYELAKNLMSITGMCVLGIWLYSSSITWPNIHLAARAALSRAILGAFIVGVLVITPF